LGIRCGKVLPSKKKMNNVPSPSPGQMVPLVVAPLPEICGHSPGYLKKWSLGFFCILACAKGCLYMLYMYGCVTYSIDAKSVEKQVMHQWNRFISGIFIPAPKGAGSFTKSFKKCII
jgi:hypothetical protein